MIQILIILVALIIGYALFINRIKVLPPGPPPLPVLGNLLQLEEELDKKLLAWKQKYGKVFTVWMPQPTIIIADSQVLQESIVKDGDKYGDRSSPEILMNMISGANYGLVFNDNHMWKEQRRFALHSLRDVGYLSSALQETAKDYAQEAVARWKKEGANGTPVDVSNNILAAVANIIWQLAFGRTLSFDDPKLVEVKRLITENFKSLRHPIMPFLEIFPWIRHIDSFVGSPIKALISSTDKLIDIMQNEIDACEKQLNIDEPSRCYVDSYLIEMKKREHKGEPLGTFTREQLKFASFDLWSAGLETTMTTLRFAIYYLMTNPEVQVKMQAEIDEKIGKRQVSTEDQKTMPYSNAVIHEVQRLGNIIIMNFFRQTNQDTEIGGYRIPAGTAIIPQFPSVHIDPEEFERPHYFCPERHLNEKGEFIKDPRITPFSIGKRACLGEGLARMELFVYLITFVQNLTFSSPTKVPSELKVEIGVTRDPLPFKVIITPRE